MSEIRWLIDGYLEWLKGEDVPVVEDVAVDLLAVETKHWARLGAPGAFVHTHARGDLCTLYLIDLPPGGATAPQRHLYESVMYVLDGSGSTVVERTNGEQRGFEFGKGSLFSLPLNMRYRLYNSSGQRRTRIAVVANLPMVMKQFRNGSFVFENEHEFFERWGEERYYRGEGTFIPTREMRNMWEANFIPDLITFDKVTESPNRGLGSKNIQFVLGETTMAAHISEVGVGNYKKAHIHGEGTHIIQLGDEGYSLYWKEGGEPRRVEWKYGLLHSPGEREWHQHFNVSDRPGRYLAMSYGGYRFPFTNANRANILHHYEKKSTIQIEYEDEDPRIRKWFDEARAKYRESKKAGVA